jgi:death-on-curing family protein
MGQKKFQGGEVIIYRSKEGKAELEVKLQEETIWLDAHQMAEIFDVDRSVIVNHIGNIYKDKELKPNSTCAIFAQVAKDGKRREMNFYNLDVIIAVGYKVNSKRATQFRIWATSVLKDHILKGYTLNQKRLQEKGLSEFEEAVGLIKRTLQNRALNDAESKGLLEVITNYASTWILLQKYDEAAIKEPKTKKSKKKFDYVYCGQAIEQLKKELMKKKEATDLFGNERNDQFQAILGNIHQTFDKQELYPSIEEKAAHLLYFVIKDHPFTDGNKRIGSFLFIVFLAQNKYLYRKNGEKKLNDNALTALALLIAESDPKQKQLMILLIMNFLSEK